MSITSAAGPESEPRTAMLSLAIAVDQPELARRIRATIEADGLTCLIEVESIDSLVTHPQMGEVQAILLRIGAARGQVLDGFKTARTHFPELPIIGLWPEDQRIEDQRALKAGIDGLLPESQIESALGPTIGAVCSGLVCFPRRLPADSQTEPLSVREKQVLGMLIMGFTNAEIARRLYLAESTVKSHLSSAYLKLGVRSRKDAAALILDPDRGLGTAILSISDS